MPLSKGRGRASAKSKIMTEQGKILVEEYKSRRKRKAPTVEEFIKRNNHEIWRQCPKCGAWEDLRKTDYCTYCQTQLPLNIQK